MGNRPIERCPNNVVVTRGCRLRLCRGSHHVAQRPWPGGANEFPVITRFVGHLRVPTMPLRPARIGACHGKRLCAHGVATDLEHRVPWQPRDEAWANGHCGATPSWAESGLPRGAARSSRGGCGHSFRKNTAFSICPIKLPPVVISYVSWRIMCALS